ncbi:unnamed protein product [Miscanthus lutarioriparius]|uniref:Uncharacterized protein n=1 Tax=Miscanthus lutarioriparius TaxID=422564 RepID=A0A811SA78_9POAL|nr:unnamed protein product [Miscanthus lutarioriparius]
MEGQRSPWDSRAPEGSRRVGWGGPGRAWLATVAAAAATAPSGGARGSPRQQGCIRARPRRSRPADGVLLRSGVGGRVKERGANEEGKDGDGSGGWFRGCSGGWERRWQELCSAMALREQRWCERKWGRGAALEESRSRARRSWSSSNDAAAGQRGSDAARSARRGRSEQRGSGADLGAPARPECRGRTSFVPKRFGLARTSVFISKGIKISKQKLFTLVKATFFA